MGNILIFVEHRDGAIKKVTYEMAGAAKALAAKTGGQVEAALVGKGVAGLAEGLGKYGVSKVYVCEADGLGAYSNQGYAAALKAVADAASPDVFVFSATSMGKDLAPRVAAKLNAGMASDATSVEWDGTLKVTRPTYAGKVNTKLEITSKPAVVSLRPNAFSPVEEGSGSAEVQNVDAPAFDIRAVVKEVAKAAAGKLDVAEANIVVAGGRGLKNEEQFKLLEDLAGVLGAAVGASRAVVDAGLRPHSEQVGQTGKVVGPTLYFAIGISGAIQHLAGMQTSKVIVAVNKDPEAPIFKVSDYGIVGDAAEIVPLLTQEFKTLLSD
jgi:electron transfer flavoprotein alpha subunit